MCPLRRLPRTANLTMSKSTRMLVQVRCPLITGSLECYTDNAYSEWLSGNSSASVQWNTTSTNQLIYHQVDLEEPMQFTEVSDQAVDGTLYYAIAQVSWKFYSMSTVCRAGRLC